MLDSARVRDSWILQLQTHLSAAQCVPTEDDENARLGIVEGPIGRQPRCPHHVPELKLHFRYPALRQSQTWKHGYRRALRFCSQYTRTRYVPLNRSLL